MVRTICFVFFIFCGFVSCYEPQGNPPISDEEVSASSSSHEDCIEDRCDRNSTYKKCPKPCPGTCDNPAGFPNCKKKCSKFGCECKTEFVLNKNGDCVKLQDCPGKCDKNSTYKKCPAPCPGTCDNPIGSPGCKKKCVPYGCECKSGFVSTADVKCVKLEDCPGKCDRNSTYKKCPAPCPGTCDNPIGSPNCKKMCSPYGCECNPGFVSTDDGKCVKLEDCPGKCDRNSTYKKCPAPCPGTCDNPIGSPNCEKLCLAFGCECKPGLVSTADGKCVKLEDCPGKCDRNSTYKKCPAPCPGTCDNPIGSPNCKKMCSPYGCECNPGFVSTDDGKCVKLEDCPGKCDRNSTYKKCPAPCPGTCDNPNGSPNCKKMCSPYGCECNPGFVSTDDGKCVKLEDCPGKCDRNSIYKKCPEPCPATCDNPIASPGCKKMCSDYGCECKPGFVSTDDGKCVKLENCPGKCDCNSTYKECPSPCPRTCGNPKGAKVCSRMCLQFGCECKPDYVLSENGKCVKLDDCPDYLRCNDGNATFKTCPSACPRTCDIPGPQPCTAACATEGCECKPDFFLNADKKCVALQDCPGAKTCSCNETFVFCKVGCPTNNCPVNDNQGIVACSPPYPCKSGCSCKKDHLRDKDGRCILFSDCPPIKCTRPNEIYSARPPPCLFDSCSDIGNPKKCERNSPSRPQCICKPGYYRDKNGVCVTEQECKNLRCNDVNAIFKECPNPCPATCEFPGGVPCNATCKKEGCECKKGFYKNKDKKCVALQECPGAKTCSSNETFVFCNVGCPTNDCPENDNQGEIACDPPYPCASGCSCKKDHLRSKDGRCILYSDCPPIECTRPNEVYSARPPPCLFESCTDIGKPNECERNYPNKPQCICKPGHFRNEDGICVHKTKCPKPITCGRNEVAVKCKTICPPQSCEIAYTDYFCTDTPCIPGCDCIDNHLRNGTGHCILNDNCPPPPRLPDCGINEVPSICKSICPPQTCASLFIQYDCVENIPCEWGCDCQEGHLRDLNGTCIPKKQCPKSPPPICGFNEVYSDRKIVCPPQSCDSIFTLYLCSNEQVYEPGCNCVDGYLRNKSGICVPSTECFPAQCNTPPECRPTCANPEPNCKYIDKSIYVPSIGTLEDCECKEGQILSEPNGVCINIEQCPDKGCNGDINSMIISCPWPYPSTCEDPKAGSNGRTCKKYGCQCKPGFVYSVDYGKCVQPDRCKCGNPCGANATFSECSFPCPNQYCPEDDSLTKVACKPGRPCPSGCNCNPYYLKKSYDDETCILASDCPPVECTRPNERWDCCASECLLENCSDLTKKFYCEADPKNCQPKCVCIDGYRRNNSGICVPVEECPENCKVQQECRPTCAVPNPPNCEYIPPSDKNIDSCNCMSDHVLSEVGGRCIKIEECPTNQSCNGDVNAVVKQCPQPCPSTCKSPNAFPCKMACVAIGCECKSGFMKNENGSCVLPSQCKGGNPCGVNGTFQPCRFECPTNYCPTDDSRAVVVCETFPFAPCFSGCSCKLNHRRFSREDPRCIVSTDCPPVNCTRPNEVWNSCPLECNSEYCDAVDSPTAVCNTLVYNCNPKCVCKDGYYRNDQDICVSKAACCKLNRQKKMNQS